MCAYECCGAKTSSGITQVHIGTTALLLLHYAADILEGYDSKVMVRLYEAVLFEVCIYVMHC